MYYLKFIPCESGLEEGRVGIISIADPLPIGAVY